MELLKEVLVENLQDLLHAELQLVQALPQMAEPANRTQIRGKRSSSIRRNNNCAS
jgi:ferritin-like metal-binding protein YciE